MRSKQWRVLKLERTNSKMKIFIIILSIIGISYIPVKLMFLKNNLSPIEGTIREVTKSTNRFAYYQFYIDHYPNVFYNSGTGVLSFFKSDERILKFNINRKIKFYINSEDIEKLKKGEEVIYIGLQDKNIIIDVFYYYFSKLNKIPFFLFCILMMCLNFYGISILKNKIFEILLTVYLFLGMLILIL